MARPRKLRPLCDPASMPAILTAAQAGRLVGRSANGLRAATDRGEVPAIVTPREDGKRMYRYRKAEILALRGEAPGAVTLTPAQLQAMLDLAAERGGRAALARLGLVLNDQERRAG